MKHLRTGEAREWDEFPVKPEDEELAVLFAALANKTEHTLLVRHRDVKQTWTVQINGVAVGRLPRDENLMVTPFALKPGLLKDGPNTLRIWGKGRSSDDVMIGDVRIIDQPVAKALDVSTLTVVVSQKPGGESLPCRITIADADGALMPTAARSTDRLALRTGMIYTADGKASFGLRPGKYVVYASRGFEYSVDRFEIDLKANISAARRMHIEREVDTTGWVACDTHIHTFTHSRHGDATMTERMITLPGEGIELPIATDHNVHIDYEAESQRTGMRRFFTPVIGNEVTTRVGHFNVFPVRDDKVKTPDWKLPRPGLVFDTIDKTPNVRVAILNHGRDLHANYRPLGPKQHISIVGENLDGWKFRPNAMELINSAALQTDPLQLYHDWFGLLNRGYKVTPIGSSDSHEVSTKLVGQGRTYIKVDDADVSKIDVDKAVDALLAGRVAVSMGLFTTIQVASQNASGGAGDLVKADGPIKVKVRVTGPSWTTADRVILYMNGVPMRDERITTPTENGKSAVVKFEHSWTLLRPKLDVHLVAVALGPGVDAPFWRIANTYQPDSITWKPYVIGSTGPVWVDADGTEGFTAARQYAEPLFEQHGDKSNDLLQALERFQDEAVAAHVVYLMGRATPQVVQAAAKRVLETATGATKSGVSRLLEQVTASREARN